MATDDSQADKGISLEMRALSKVYRSSKGKADSSRVTALNLIGGLRCEEEDVFSALNYLRGEGYLSRLGDDKPEEKPSGKRFADIRSVDLNAYFSLTKEGAKHYRSLCGEFEPDETQEKILDILKSKKRKTLTVIATELSKDGVSIEEVEGALDELEVYSKVDLNGNIFTGTYTLHK